MERSQCPACGAQIGARDNVPVVSWLLLRGRARCCGERISARYPLTELTVGVLFAATALVYWDDPALAAIGMVFVAMLAVVTLTDFERRVIFLHGVPEDAQLPDTVQSLGDVPAHVTLPIACGEIRKAEG